MEHDPVLAILKFGKECHIKQFVSEGLLYMNALAFFATIEGQSIRRDPDEGVGRVLHHAAVRIGFKKDIEDVYTPIGPLAGPIRFRAADSLKPNVFCMYAIRATAGSPLVNPRNFEFGDTFVLLRDGDEFLRRARIAAQDSGQEIKCGLVQYVHETYSGLMGPFRKYSTFSYQSEARIALFPGTGAPYELRLGNLTDIVALVAPLSEINDHITIIADSDTTSIL